MIKLLISSILMISSFVAYSGESLIYETQEIELKESRRIGIDKTKNLELSGVDEKELTYTLSCSGTFNSLQLIKEIEIQKRLLLVKQNISFDQCQSVLDKLTGHLRWRAPGTIFTVKLKVDVSNKKIISYELAKLATGKNYAE